METPVGAMNTFMVAEGEQSPANARKLAKTISAQRYPRTRPIYVSLGDYLVDRRRLQLFDDIIRFAAV